MRTLDGRPFFVHRVSMQAIQSADQAKVAVIYSGHARTARHTLANQFWMVLRRYPNRHVFAHLANDADGQWFLENADRYLRCNVTVKLADQPAQFDEYSPETHAHAPYDNSVSNEAIQGQLWHMEQALAMVHRPELFHTFIRMRPDVFFHEYDKPAQPAHNEAHTPFWGRFGGCNDRFAVMGQTAATAYLSTFSRIDQHLADGCPLHPESLVRHSLESAGCVVTNAAYAVFSTVRANGEIRFPEIQHHETK